MIKPQLIARVLVCASGPALLARGCSPCCPEAVSRDPKCRGTSAQLLKPFCLFLAQLSSGHAVLSATSAFAVHCLGLTSPKLLRY